jgi:[ribosomal protein S5]-alanine N-acetyltransferase
MAIDINGEAIGGIGIHPKDDIECKNAEMGYWLGEPFWGNGIITKAVLQMVDYGFVNFEIDRIFARPFGTNIASQKVLEKTGFVLEARFAKTLFKFGEYQDELIYAIRRNYSILAGKISV